ncbi:hypothetical protein GBA65_12065 [Rubrobacter marinus]|uniref:Uncharacterized protein n=1 Tax=Rubrobacter marinus TaxID=2653852 RepID=A0A6G8PYA1_9ACTN|nr:hypothetical protein [Rubrobacter marinus]QIN79138.1 hypothetical protein GBA65_12065 [Rubrobacter marinus]
MRSPGTRAEKPGYALHVLADGLDPPRYAYVEVRFRDGRRRFARLHTPEGVRAILDEWRRRGERSGLYFWAPGVIVVREITRAGIAALVEDLMAEGELEVAFVPAEDC